MAGSGLKGPPTLLLFAFLPLAGAFPVSFFGAAHRSLDKRGVGKGKKMDSRLELLFEEETAILDHRFFLGYFVITFAKEEVFI